MEYQIDARPIPIPQSTGPGRRRLHSWPFDKIGVGESFTTDSANRAKVMGAAKSWKRSHPGWNYTAETKGGTTRIWRIA